MADQWTLLRPSSLYARSAGMVTQAIAVPTGAEAADNSDATWIFGSALDTNEYVVYNMTDFAFPAGSRITLLYPIVRTNSAGGNPITPGQGQPLPYVFNAYCQCAGEDSPGGHVGIYQQGWVTTGLATKATKSNGQPFTPDEVNNTLLGIFWDLTNQREGTNGYKYAALSEFYVYVYYNVRPTTVVTGPGEGASVTTTSSPTVTWTYTDPESDAKTAHRVKIFTAAQYGAAGFDPETSAATVDSGEVSGAGLSFSYSTLLANNTTHRAYVKTKDHLQWSLWDYNQFTINVTPPGSPGSTQPGAPSLIVTEESALARVKLELNEGTAPTVDWFTIERSLDGGVTWEKVRDANPIPYPNLYSQAQSEFETSLAGWTAFNMVAGWPTRDVGQIYSGAYALNLKVASAALDTDAYGPYIPSIPGVAYRIRLWVRSEATPRIFRPYIRWSVDGIEWTSSGGPGADVVSVVNGWREIVVEAVCPAGSFYMGAMVRIPVGAAVNELHYIDAVSTKKKILPITLYDNEVPRRLPVGMLKYRAQGVRYSAPQEQPMVTTTSTPYTANMAGSLATDDRNWLKSPSDPALNIPVRFGFGSGDRWELDAKEEESIFLPKGRGSAVVFGSNTESEEFDLPLVFLTDTEYAAFEKLRKRREPLLLQTRYGEPTGPAVQVWIKIGTRKTRIMNTTIQGPKTARKVNLSITNVGQPPGTIVALPGIVGAIDGVWMLLPVTAPATADLNDPPMIMKDSRGVVHMRGRINNVAINMWAIAAGGIPVGYRPDGNTYFSYVGTFAQCANRMVLIASAGQVIVGSTASLFPNSPNDFLLLDRVHYQAIN